MGVATPERRLAAAVVAQAFQDMGATCTVATDTADTIAIQAIKFLTDRSGHAAQWRNRWCSYLDMDGDQLAARVRGILDGEINPPDMRGITLARARERWVRLRPATSTAPEASPARLPSIKRPTLTVTRPTIEPEDVDLSTIDDDPFHVSASGHLAASRPWSDGEVSRILGALPPYHSRAGQLIWTFCQTARNGKNALYNLGITADAAIQALKEVLPHCDVLWSSKGERLPEYRPNAGLRLYLKQLANAA